MHERRRGYVAFSSIKFEKSHHPQLAGGGFLFEQNKEITMQWMLLLKSAYQPRAESRVLQVLDHFMVDMESFSSMRMAHDLWITLVFRTEQVQAERIRGRLGKLQCIKRLQMYRSEQAILQTTAVVKIWCDQESRLPILQVLSSIEANVLAMTSFWMAFEVSGPVDRLSVLNDILCPYGIIESFSAASLLAHTGAEVPEDQDIGFSVSET
jgi:acetolactate synthase small subunit